MKRSIFVIVVLAATAIGAVAVYQTAARDRQYRDLVARGDAALAQDQTFGAIEAYSGAIALRPDSMLAHLRRGETYLRRGDLDAAARDFRTAGAYDPAATRPLEELGDVLYQMQRYHRAAEVYESCLKLDDRSARVSYKVALARYRDRDLDLALAAVRQALRLNDRSADAEYLLGVCLREKRRTPEAQRAFENAVSLSPGLIAAREELADLYAAQGRRADELEQLQLIAGLDRSHPDRQVAVALAHARAGHADAAVLTLGSALERSPDQPTIYTALGRVWLDIAQSRSDRVALNKALEALGRVANSAGATSEALMLYGRALAQEGDVDSAERVLQQATERFPVDPSAFLHYAVVAEQQNHLAAARRALIEYGSLVGEDPELGSRAARIASLSLRLSDPVAAVDWFERAAQANPRDVTLLAGLAQAQVKAADPDGARHTIARGLALDPANPALLALSRKVR